MGLDLVELALEVEEAFGITIADEDWATAITVGDVHRLVLAHTAARPARCPSASRFRELRRLLFGRLRPSSDVEQAIPQHDRRRRWREIASALPFRLPPLARPPALRRASEILALLGFGLLAFGPLLAAGPSLALAAFLALWPPGHRVPEGCRTLGDVIHRTIAIDPPHPPVAMSSADAWRLLAELTAAQADLPVDRIEADTKLLDLFPGG